MTLQIRPQTPLAKKVPEQATVTAENDSASVSFLSDRAQGGDLLLNTHRDAKAPFHRPAVAALRLFHPGRHLRHADLRLILLLLLFPSRLPPDSDPWPPGSTSDAGPPGPPPPVNALSPTATCSNLTQLPAVIPRPPASLVVNLELPRRCQAAGRAGPSRAQALPVCHCTKRTDRPNADSAKQSKGGESVQLRARGT